MCVVVCVFSSLCVRGDCLRTGTRQPNLRDTVCYIAEYKHPHYRVSLNVSDTERRMKGPTISEKNEKKTASLGEEYDKLLKKAVLRAQSHLSVCHISQSTAGERDREVDFDTWVRIFTDIL